MSNRCDDTYPEEIGMDYMDDMDDMDSQNKRWRKKYVKHFIIGFLIVVIIAILIYFIMCGMSDDIELDETPWERISMHRPSNPDRFLQDLLRD